MATRPRTRQPTAKRPATRAAALEEWLTDAIIRGHLLPGMRLEEQALADRYGVSRTPVREALRRLAATGLVESQPRRGVFVAEISRDRLDEMFQTMATLEAACAGLAATRMTLEERRNIATLQADGTTLAATGDVGAYTRHNTRFHHAVYDGAHNSFLAETTLAVRQRLAPFRSAQFQIPGRLAKSAHEHAQVAQAIIDGDAAGAHASMFSHVSTVSIASAAFASDSYGMHEVDH